MRDWTRKYLKKSYAQRRREYLSAKNGNKEDLEKFMQYTNDLAKDVNHRMVELERHSFNYGKRVNSIKNWATANNSTRDRLLSSDELKSDIDAMYVQNEIAYDFIHDPNTLVINAKQVTEKRFERFQDKFKFELGNEFEELTPRKFKNFLRWLGDETTHKALEAYATSEIVVDIALDIYKKRGSTGLKILNKLMLEWLAHINDGYDFNAAMEKRFKIDVEDYREKWQGKK